MADSDQVFISVDSDDGKQLLTNAIDKGILKFSQKQNTRTSCGICTAAICLNAMLSGLEQGQQLRGVLANVKTVLLPLSEKDLFLLLDSSDLLNLEKVNIEGISLTTFSKLISAFCFGTRVFYSWKKQGNDKYFQDNEIHGFSLELFRQTVIKFLTDPTCQIVVNFYLPHLEYNNAPVGHFSPLGAYNAVCDRFLVLDVGRTNPICWVKAERLYEAMMIETNSGGDPRGFCVITSSL